MKKDSRHQSLPHDTDMETALLGSLLLEPGGFAVVGDRLKKDVFYSDRHETTYSAMRAIVDRGDVLDAATLHNELIERGQIKQVGGPSFIASLLDGVPRAANLPHYLTILERLAYKRRIAGRADQLARAALNGKTGDDLVQIATEIAEDRPPTQERVPLRSLDLRRLMMEAEEPIPWAIRPWFATRDVCILAAEPKTGKSWLALDLAISLASGRDWMGLLPVAQQARVLYLDEEQNPSLVRSRVRMLARAGALTAEYLGALPLRYLSQNSLNLDRPERLHALFAEIDQFRPDVLILDSLVRFHARDENSNSDMASFFAGVVNPIRSQFSCGFVLLHHLSKPGKDNGGELSHRVRGASDITAAADQVWGLERDKAGRLTLRHEMARWAETSPALAIEIADTSSGGVEIRAVEIEADAENVIRSVLVDAGPDGLLRQEILRALESEGLSAGDRLATKHLGRLHATGALRKSNEGRAVRYWITQAAPDEAE